MIKPVRNNVLVRCFVGDAVSDGGIVIPDSMRVDSDKVEVIAVGAGTPKKPMTVKAGDIGYRVHGWGEPIIDNGEKYYMMDSSAIIALV